MVSLSIAPVRASNGEAASQNGILGAATILRDITEQKQLEARQIAADRMASVGVLAAGVAHEVNNPLMALLANLELALAALESGTHAGTEDLRGQLLDAGNAARMVRDIVRDLNLLSRDEGEVRRPTDVHAVLESAIRISLSDISLRARLVRDLDPVPAVLANESRLGQVFVNLLVNAFQAIPEGDPDRHRITVSTRSAGDMVSISVTDTGMGIPPDVQSRIFTPFFTTKPVGEGTGLGLSICRSIIDRFGGSLTLSSQVGRGSTFVVYLMATSEAPVVLPSRPTRAVSGRRGRVLLVDDDPMILRVLHRILSSRHDVTLASSAHDALDRIADAATPFDLILCDLMMPGMTGIDLYERLSEGEVGPSVPFLFLTGGVFTDKARAFLDVTPVDCIEKPVEADALRRLVAAHMA